MSALKSILIVGAGEFGASTAVSLLKTGRYTVRILDRSSTLPSPDAESCDINKILRFDYDDVDYCRLAKEAIGEWKKDEWKGIYHNSGVLVRGADAPDFAKDRILTTWRNVQAHEPSIRFLTNPSEITSHLSPLSSTPTTPPNLTERAYLNHVGGWAHASAAVEKLYRDIRQLGGEITPAAEMEDLLFTPQGDLRGVRCKDGREFGADKTILAFGSWMAAHPALKGMLPDGLVTATGQVVAGIQLNEEDAKRYADIPVPNKDGMVKFAIHGAGYLSDTGVPRTSTDPEAITYIEQNQVGWIPSESLKSLRKQLTLDYPDLANRPIAFTRMCWYADVVDGDWVIDYSPNHPSLLLATGGSGHAFTFLPIIGNLIQSRLEGTLDSHLSHKWRLRDSTFGQADTSKIGMTRRPLDLGELATHAELANEHE